MWHTLQLQRRTQLIAGISLLIIVVILLTCLHSFLAGIVEWVFRFSLFLIVVGLSLYKLVIWFRYRHDPEKRERIVYAGQIYPEKIRRFLMDERVDDKKKF